MTELTEAQKIILKAQKDEYERKQKSWSIDRAVEIVRCQSFKGNATAESVIVEAQKLVAYMQKTPKYYPIPTADEAQQAVEQMQATGEL